MIQNDASSRGLGAVLIQHGKPIAFASKSLSDCEQRYANTECEMLAVVFGCERFHMYVYGKSFILESDHKPLEMINLTNLAAAPQRLQHMFLRVQPYDFVLRYKPGKQMMLADVMSRQPSSETKQIDLDVQVSFVQFSMQKLQTIREANRPPTSYVRQEPSLEKDGQRASATYHHRCDLTGRAKTSWQ